MAQMPPLPPAVQTARPKFAAVASVKQAAQLKARPAVEVVTPPTMAVGLEIPITWSVQWSADLQTWTNVCDIPIPTLWTNLPAPGSAGNYRVVTESTFGGTVMNLVTNTP